MPTLGSTELLIVLGLAVLLFGGTKLPQLMRGMGEGMKEFKKATRDDDEPVKTPISTTNSEPRV